MVLRLTFLKLVSYSFIRPGVVLATLLMLPLPGPIERLVVKFCDSILFFYPHPHIPLSMYWSIVISCLLSLALNLKEYRELVTRETINANKITLSQMQLKLMTKERNCWISAFSLLLIVVIYRFRGMRKSTHKQIKALSGTGTDELPVKRENYTNKNIAPSVKQEPAQAAVPPPTNKQV